ncbi:unnamed protein product [Prunus brigantina]
MADAQLRIMRSAFASAKFDKFEVASYAELSKEIEVAADVELEAEFEDASDVEFSEEIEVASDGELEEEIEVASNVRGVDYNGYLNATEASFDFNQVHGFKRAVKDFQNPERL